jgi:hypothetical protein
MKETPDEETRNQISNEAHGLIYASRQAAHERMKELFLEWSNQSGGNPMTMEEINAHLEETVANYRKTRFSKD